MEPGKRKPYNDRIIPGLGGPVWYNADQQRRTGKDFMYDHIVYNKLLYNYLQPFIFVFT